MEVVLRWPGLLSTGLDYASRYGLGGYGYATRILFLYFDFSHRAHWIPISLVFNRSSSLYPATYYIQSTPSRMSTAEYRAAQGQARQAMAHRLIQGARCR